MNEMKDMELQELSGIRFPPEKLSLRKLGNFLYHEGPLLSHLINEKNEDFLMLWCDVDKTYNRWLLSKTNYFLLNQYFQENVTLRDLIISNPDGFVYFVDIDNNIDWKRAFIVPIESIDDDYLPGEGSGFAETGFEPYAHQLKSYLEYHFARKQKLYAPATVPEIALVMDLPSDAEYGKTKK